MPYVSATAAENANAAAVVLRARRRGDTRRRRKECGLSAMSFDLYASHAAPCTL